MGLWPARLIWVKFSTELQLHQAVTHELAGCEPTTLEIVELPGPGHEFESDHIGVCLAICHPFGHDVPNDHQQFASDGDNGLTGLHATGQLLELLFPMGMRTDGDPGRFDQGPAQFSPTLLGDMTGMMGLTAIVDTAAQASIANQFLGLREAGDIADRRENGHDIDQPKARQLQEIGRVVLPRRLGAQMSQFLIDFADLGFEMIQQGQILADTQLLHRKKG